MTMVKYTLKTAAKCYNGEYRHSGYLEFSWCPQEGLQKGIWQCSGKREVAIKGDITNISFYLGGTRQDECLVNNLDVLNKELQARFNDKPSWIDSEKVTIVITARTISINGQDIKVRSKSQEPQAALSLGAGNRGLFSRIFCCVPRRASEENRPILGKG